VRRQGDPAVGVVDLTTGALSSVALSGAVTDLDLTPDGARAVAVVFVEYPCATSEFANVTHLLGLGWASGPDLPQRTLAGS